MYPKIIKPILDFSIAFFALLLFSPIFSIITLFLTFANNGTPFFIQTRPGKKEKPFNIIKFKTMNDKKDKNGHLLSDAKRLTTIGKFVRKTSLDEIPQLLNVLKGDMSLIGPRPLLLEYLPLYNKEQQKRHLVKPGITGWAQINGRNAISWEDKFKYDVAYVNNINFLTDLKIIFKTIKKVVISEGISADGNVTIGKFKG
ncbi:MAG: sugar transferase [Flavobacteriaceae bacterium]|nr:sugar transferase [Flavobacteriaceae bacterium]